MMIGEMSPSFHLLFISIFTINLLFSIYVYVNLNLDDEDILDDHQPPRVKKSLKDDITFVILDFDDFNHDLKSTIEHLCSESKPSNVLVVSQSKIYPPISIHISQSCPVTFIVRDQLASTSYIRNQPEYHITSHYVMIIPDATRLTGVKHANHILLPDAESLHVISSNSIQDECYSLNIDLKSWTATYTKVDSDEANCDFMNGSSYGFILQTSTYLSLYQPFFSPSKESIFIQSKIHGIQVSRKSYMSLKIAKNLMSDAITEWKHQLEYSNRLNKLYTKLGIKKVIYRSSGHDDEIQWFNSCTKSSSRCFPTIINNMPSYIYEGRLTPPCCLEHLRQTAKHVFHVLDTYGIKYWMEGGTLLGAVRSGDIIPWDSDVDIGVYQDELSKLSIFETCRTKGPVIDEFEFLWEKAVEGDFYRVHFSPNNRLHVDIFPFYPKDGMMTKDFWFSDHPQDTSFPEHFLEPLIRIPFAGLNASAPNHPQEFLEYKFGPGCIENPKLPDPHVKINLIN